MLKEARIAHRNPPFVRFGVLLLLAVASACAPQRPYVTTIGVLKPGATLVVRVGSATVNAYQPVAGMRRDVFTIAATALANQPPPPPPRLRLAPLGAVVRAPDSYASILVRVPERVDLVVLSQRGNVNVTDVTGNVRIAAGAGNVDAKLPGYAQAEVGMGNLSVTMGATAWPGTLHFSTQRGDVALWISAKAAFTVHLHTGNGVLFTDFGLRGTANGSAETIDGTVNGGSPQRIDVETPSGDIRLFRLQPQP
jgi:hypothetical protein